jgi:tagatose 6-phosphate kinase
MILTVTLNPTLDKAVAVDDLRVGELVKVKKVNYIASGKGVNVARVLKLLGADDVAATGFSGGVHGEYLERSLEKEKIQNYFVKISGDTRENTTVIDTISGTETHFIEPGPIVTQEEIAKFIKLFLEKLERSEFVVLSGSPPPGVPEDIYRELIHEAGSRGVKSSLDTRDTALKLGLEAKPFLAKPNLEELEGISGRKLTSLKETAQAAGELVEKGINMVIVSLGKDGMILINEDDTWKATPPQVPVVNSVGSGDALLAGFLFSYLSGRNVEDSIRLGMACGVANCVKPVAGAFGMEEAEHFQNEISVSKL